MKFSFCFSLSSLLLFAQETFAQSNGANPPAAGQQPPQYGFLIVMLAIFAIFWLLIIRPQQKQQKEKRNMLANLQKGDLIITQSGFHGKIVGVTDKVLTVELADNLKVKMEREGILSKREEK